MRQLWILCVLVPLLSLGFSCSKDAEDPVLASGSTSILLDNYEGNDLVLLGSESLNLMLAFEHELEDGSVPELQGVEEVNGPIVMRDMEGNAYNAFGRIIEGPRAGQRLKAVQFTMGYYLAFAAFYPDVDIYGQGVGEGPANIEMHGDWLVPEELVYNGGPPKDGIPALEDPDVASLNASELDYVQDDRLVVGVEVQGQQRAYSHQLLDWHEIVNDEIAGEAFAVVYCPLTGTATNWDRNINGEVTTFGVSGWVYNTNVVPYDRATDSSWSQLRGDCINGEHLGVEVVHRPIVETDWSTWQLLFPDSDAATTNTGHSRDYLNYPYRSYRTDETVYFPLTYQDERIPLKERVMAVIIAGNARVYRFSDF